jgi:TPR repeat protein
VQLLHLLGERRVVDTGRGQGDVMGVRSWVGRNGPRLLAFGLVALGILLTRAERALPPQVESLWKLYVRREPAEQLKMGEAYASGDGVAQDYAEAAIWFRKAAEQGDPFAQIDLGDLYISGDGVAKDDAQAVAWYRKAADQGYAVAQFKLGTCYANGRGVDRDDELAAYWYWNAAELGYAQAQFTLGLAYLTGVGVTKSEAQAESWFRKAAEQGDSAARLALATLHPATPSETQIPSSLRKAAD